jgi:zinc protease
MVDKYLAGIDKVTPEDIQRVARKYLVETNRTVGVLVPTGILRRPGGGGMSHGPISHAAMIGGAER